MTAFEIIKSIAGLFKLTPRHLAIFAIASSIILFVPTQVFKPLGITTLNDNYRLIIAIIFILSISGLSIELIIYLYRKMRLYRFIQKGKARLDILTQEEKKLLLPYISSETRTHYFRIENGTAAELEALGILVRYTEVGHLMSGIAYGISEWAYQYLIKKKHLLTI